MSIMFIFIKIIDLIIVFKMFIFTQIMVILYQMTEIQEDVSVLLLNCGNTLI